MKMQGTAIVWHRWLGIAFCFLFLFWFASGIVMMYAHMPVLSPEERLARLPQLDAAQVKLSPAEAWAKSGEKAPWRQAVLTTIAQRPAYRFTNSKGDRPVVFADNGQRFTQFSQAQAEASLRSFLPAGTGFQWQPVLNSPDQWTVQRMYVDNLPLYHATVQDGKGSEVYLSSRTGEVILQTNTQTRLLAWAGAIPHWLYLRAVRVYAEEWRLGVIWLSGIGGVMTILGIAAGLWRYSPSRKYRNRELGPQPTPYQGAKKWHHYTGLIFGALAFTFVISGMLSLNPGRWSTGSSPSAQQMAVFSGGRVDPSRFSQLPSQLRSWKEVEFLQVQGQALLRTNQQLFHLNGAAFTPPSTETLLRSAQAAAGNASITSTQLLTEYGSYYYDRKYKKPLPVLEVKLSDAAGTWFYIDPATGLPVNRYESSGRWERWLYHGLHSLDFPGLWQRRPLWDIVVILASLGGVYLSWSGVQIGWDRLRAKFRRRRSQAVVARPTGSTLPSQEFVS